MKRYNFMAHTLIFDTLILLFFLHISFASSPSVVTACINIYGLALKPYNALSVLAAMNEAKVEVNVVQVSVRVCVCVCVEG